VFALEMMKQRASYETELRLKADFLGDLFSEIATTQQSDMLRRANFLGFNFNKPAILLIVDNVQNTGAKEADLMNVQHHNRHTIAKIQHAVTSFVEENLVANQSGRIVIIVPASVNGSDSSQTVLELDSIIRSAIQRIDCEANIIIGVGNVFQDINGVRHSFIEATRALDAAKSLRKVNATVRLSDLGIYGVLYRKGDSDELLKFARISLLPLIEYDRENGTELLETLNVYLKHQSQLARTARKLYIHVNTLRQRLQRIERVLDIELDNHNVILNLQLALRVYEIAPEIYTSN
jgi:DNA-binding PucR family transcriptional regulator